jgi:23S rRNA A2030 N6-methylase RlmJ
VIAELFLTESSQIEPLRNSPYRRAILGLARGAVPSYPGSPLLAMMLLGRACRYVFCDTDPSSAADLRVARERLSLQKEVQVIDGDGLAETTALLEADAIGSAGLVHVDPFDFGAAEPSATSALQLATHLAAAGIATFAWYGLTSRSAPHDLFHDVTAAAPTARAWSAEVRVDGQRANAAGIGSGCGVLFTGTDLAPVESMRRAADAYVCAFNEHRDAADTGVHITASFAMTASDTR